VNAEIARAIHARATDTELEALALAQGWPSLASDAARPLAAGETTLAEVLRVVTL
jgi:type II secretory ATPase GspE/PulE/Tfp pilus assembly ATPase PilB-like protein